MHDMQDIHCEFHYDAAHYLPNVPDGHKCGRMHGHTYHLTVTVTGAVDPDSGWVMDFADIKSYVKHAIHTLDHHLLNDVDGLENPTAENQVRWLWSVLSTVLPALSQLRLQEGVGNSVIYPPVRHHQ